MLRNSEQRYGSLSIGLHWLTLLLMIAVYGLMEFRDIFPKGSAGRDLMKEFHGGSADPGAGGRAPAGARG